jgi:hypothetical protein
MSTQTDVNANPNQFILYYCGIDQKDETVHQQDSSDVCAFSYNEKSGNLQIEKWYLKEYLEPTDEILTSFALDEVLAWFDAFYLLPQQINNAQHLKVSADQLKTCRTDDSMKNFLVYNTTTQTNQYFDGSVWTDCKM